MKIACTTIYDASDRNAFGGRGFYMIRSIAAESDTSLIGPLHTNSDRILTKAKRLLCKRRSGGKFSEYRDRSVVKGYSRQIAKQLNGSRASVIFSPMSPGSQPVAYLDSKLPICIWTDATLAAASVLYPHLGSSGLCQASFKDGLENERNAIDRASLLIYTSRWAAQSAISIYRVSPSKVRILPFGANLESEPSPHEVHSSISRRRADICKLLFISKGWVRKGGNIAAKIVERLNEEGQSAELIVVGQKPALPEPFPSYIRYIGFLNKSITEKRETLTRLLSTSHFLLMPTRADCTPFVFSEACAYGLPCLSTNVGGVGSVILDDINGHVFPLDATPDAYARHIGNIISNEEKYRDLARSAYDDYRERQSWKISTGRLLTWLSEL